jgi:uncharacterized repeat protein (TIGR02543 family)
LPSNPTKDGYEFDGWTMNGVDLINPSEMAITENVIFIAQFTKLHTVTFMYDSEIISTQTIRNGNYATDVEVENTDYKVFNGWKVNDTFVDLSTYKIVGATTFIADITYKYDVTFVVDNEVANSQIVVKNETTTLPSNPEKDGYDFVGWSIDGETCVDVTTIQITETTTFNAIFRKKLDVKFMVDSEEYSTQSVSYNTTATLPDEPTKNGYEFVGWADSEENIIDIASYQITEDVSFYAVFKVVSYTKTFSTTTPEGYFGTYNYKTYTQTQPISEPIVAENVYSKIIVNVKYLDIYEDMELVDHTKSSSRDYTYVDNDDHYTDEDTLTFTYDADAGKYVMEEKTLISFTSHYPDNTNTNLYVSVVLNSATLEFSGGKTIINFDSFTGSKSVTNKYDYEVTVRVDAIWISSIEYIV